MRCGRGSQDASFRMVFKPLNDPSGACCRHSRIATDGLLSVYWSPSSFLGERRFWTMADGPVDTLTATSLTVGWQMPTPYLARRVPAGDSA